MIDDPRFLPVIIESLLYIVFLLIVLPQKKEKKTGSIIIAAGLVFYAAASVVAMHYIMEPWGALLRFSLLFIFAELICGGYHFQKLSACLAVYIIMIASTFVNWMQDNNQDMLKNGNVYGLDDSASAVDDIGFGLYTHVISIAIQLLFLLAAVIIIRRTKVRLIKSLWALFALMLFTSVIVINLVTVFYMQDDDSIKKILFYILVAVSVFESIFVFWAFVKILKSEKEKIMIDSFISQVGMEVNSVEENEKKLAEMKMLRHEMRNTYIMIRELINEEKYDEAVKKISEITKDAEDEISELSVYDTGSVSVNAVLNYYVRRFRKSGIKTDCIVDSTDTIKQMEDPVCSILLNLLKNAWEAPVPESDGNVIIVIKEEMNYLLIQVMNRLASSVLDNNKDLKTTKPDIENHGFGIKAVKRMAGSCGGEFRAYEKEGYLYAETWLLIPKKEKNN